MNSRQRRGVVLIVLSAVCAVAAFAGVLAVIDDVESKVGPEVTAYELRRNVKAYEELREDQFTAVRVPERWLPETAVRDLDFIRERIAVTALSKGSLLQREMAAERPELGPGQREIAVMIDAGTGVAGKIRVGNRVDIFATFDGDERRGRADSSQLIVSRARVLGVGELRALDDSRDDDEYDTDEVVPITFALSVQDAQRVAYAESFATHVRLALVAPGDDSAPKPDERSYTLDEDQ
ncbi:Flp pilus assembly protein CpaB [Streptomyces capparidis]